MIQKSMSSLCPSSCKLNLIKFSPERDYSFLSAQKAEDEIISELSASGEAKREFFKSIKDKTKECVVFSTKNIVEIELERKIPTVELEHKNKIGLGRNPSILDFLQNSRDGIVVPDKEISSRLFSEMSIYFDSCNGCNLCYSICPTGSLFFAEGDQDIKGVQRLGFRAKDCISCKLCQDACRPGCISLVHKIKLSKLLSDEHSELKIPTYIYTKER
ncbi:MAG: 4Fe-4S binding protein [Eggerthellaceae bacterium]|nr:4Fe-4S binding protein [Eggerthellaceae bacterium]